MSIIRTIEGATLLTIGAFCATVLINFAVHGTNTAATGDSKLYSNNTVAAVNLGQIVVHGKRLTPAQKAAMANANTHALG
jgi:hypothetical protein